MFGLVEWVFNIELSLVIGIVASFVLGVLLLLIKVPKTEYAGKIAKTKNIIAICFLVCSVLFFMTLRYSGMPDYDAYTSRMIFVVTAIASAVLSFSLINLLDEHYIENDKILLNIGVVVVASFILMRSFWWDDHLMRSVVMIASVLLFIIQCSAHITVFNKVYGESIRQLELYYDEEEEHKVRWIRFCYIIMMLTQMFILVYLFLPSGLMKVYTTCYSIFMLYFTANFISFLGSHKLLLDAFAYRTLSGQDIMHKIAENRIRGGLKARKGMSDDDFNEAEFRRLERSLDKWVSEKKFKEYDKSREEIATELRTSKETLHLYFVTKLGVDFKTWRTQLRIEESKRLLLENSDLSVNVISEMAGFSDRSNFHRQFVKIVGCSPKQWRDSGGHPELFR